MFKNFKISCDEATTICDKNQYGEATLLDKIKLNIHFLTCKICALYTKQNTKLTSIYTGYSNQCKHIQHTLNNSEKEELKKKFQELK